MTLQDLIDKYFVMMRARPSLADLARFTMEVPTELQLQFLEWLRVRAEQLEAMGYAPKREMLN